VHAALSDYILLALSWAFIYGLIEIISPGAFSLASPRPMRRRDRKERTCSPT